MAIALCHLRALSAASLPQGQSLRGGRLMNEASSQMIVFEDVSKFYGEILGVNRVSHSIAPGITSLVGPNGARKTKLMNLMTGLIRPTRGQINILVISTNELMDLFSRVGNCSQTDSFTRVVTGREFIIMR